MGPIQFDCQEPFRALYAALDGEGVMSNPEKKARVPHQYFSVDLTEFVLQFLEFLGRTGETSSPIVVYVDGVRKLLADSTDSADDDFKAALEAAKIKVVFRDASKILGVKADHLHACLDYIEALREEVRQYPLAVFCVLGSGSLTDLIKHALHLELPQRPFVTVPTALTVTAFTSAFAILDTAGAKRTFLSRPVSATFWIAAVFSQAPKPLSQAGFGDLLSRFVSYADWYLGFVLGMRDTYNEMSFRLFDIFGQRLKLAAAGFNAPTLALNVAADSAATLAMAGIAMSVSGETTTVSGYEHIICYGMDYLRTAAHTELVLHGEQVAIGSLVSAAIIDHLISLQQFPLDSLRFPTAPQVQESVRSLITSAPYEVRPESLGRSMAKAEEVFGSQAVEKAVKWGSCREKHGDLGNSWAKIRENLARLTVRADDMRKLLMQSGLPTVPENLNPTTTRAAFDWSLDFAPFINNRFCVGDVVYWLDLDPNQLYRDAEARLPQ
mmetsp:Transcript_6014/g.10322  ORF Transcript_6014/g.10322 Transcript_6014/m.10322 type:complete len:496 (-) Transcript_6014:109-1596(-)|eukprot:CAMPEP_0196661058 /NCGR_PEP_ID=MMETSP1086-20130531/42466_1 /TAXON_ID=77921 /ORGANISM="Cyanoptyche  gloeocystis , Strain SAG4.97" /LENGTH=495 /DNA_ID=CAMNT_0041995789 /DNA_START=113 /DNA_END=1600 /DNA_ORIENTATION=-